MTSPQTKSGSPDLGAAWGAPNRTYPDQATRDVRGDGDGIGFIARIIHDFISYNHEMRFDLGRLLQSSLSARDLELLRGAAAEAESRGLPIYIVGGLPRDLALGGPATDLDLVVEGDAISLARALAAKFGGQVTSHPKFGTAKWSLGQSRSPMAAAHAASSGVSLRDHIDLISARSEKYHKPGQLPKVKFGGIDDDLRRRDFTINTLALRLDGSHFGEVHDPFGARADLQHGIVRALHPASFLHDPTRMYRAVRYEKRYGFRMAPQTRALVAGARQHVGALSSQRIRHELDLILDEDQAAAMLRRLAALDLLRPIHAALPANRSTLRRLEIARMPAAGNELGLQRRDSRWLLWLIGLSAAQIRSINHRLHFRRELLEAALAAATLHRESLQFVRWKPSRITEYLDKSPLPAVQAAHQSATSARAKAVLQEYLTRWRNLRPLTTGKDLKGLGLAPGPAYRIVLGDLRRSWLDGSITSAKEEHQELESLLDRLPKSAKLGATGPSLAKREL